MEKANAQKEKLLIDRSRKIFERHLQKTQVHHENLKKKHEEKMYKNLLYLAKIKAKEADPAENQIKSTVKKDLTSQQQA